MVARRAPGGPFGAPQELARATVEDFFGTITAQAGMSAAGEAIVAWTVPRGQVARSCGRRSRRRARRSARRSGSPTRWMLRAFELAVAPDGRALIAFASGQSPAVAERAPGAAFGAPQTLSGAGGVFAYDPAVALRPDGGAMVAWTEFSGGPVVAAVRDRPGTFGALAPVPGAAPSLFDLFDPLLEGRPAGSTSRASGSTASSTCWAARASAPPSPATAGHC